MAAILFRGRWIHVFFPLAATRTESGEPMLAEEDKLDLNVSTESAEEPKPAPEAPEPMDYDTRSEASDTSRRSRSPIRSDRSRESSRSISGSGMVNTLRPRQNGHHFPDDILKCIFWNENV